MVGLFRFKTPIALLLNYIAQRKATHVLECYGDGPYRSIIESMECENIHYRGSFKNPEDILGIYDSIDVNYVVYDYNDRNVQLALPNKLFESAFFGVPILCGKNTALGGLSEKWEIGTMVRIENQTDFNSDMDIITKEWIREKSRNCFKINESSLLDDGNVKIANFFKDLNL